MAVRRNRRTPVPVFPVLEQTVTPTATPKPEPEPKPEPKVVAVTSITLNKSDLTLDEGATSTLTVKYTPTNATDKSTTWRSTNTKVATVNSSGKVTAVKAGSVAIIATCGGKEAYCNVTVKVKEQTSQTSSTTTTGSPSIITANNPKTGSVNGHEWVDLGLSVKWATCNVGASKPEDYGEYYAWGEISTKSRYIWENYRFRTSGDSNDNVKFSKYNSKSDKGTVDNKTTLDLSDDVARQKFGGSWRMPTDSEFQELIDNCTWTWVTQNGVNGFKVTSKKSGYMGSSIFLPAAGYRNDTSLSNDGYFGYYWSSSVYMSLLTDYAKYLNLYFSGNHFINYNRRCYGLPVRPVCP